MSLMRRKIWPFDILDDFFEEFWKPSSLALMQFPELSIPRIQFPRLDIKEFEKDYLIKAEVPGYGKEDINIEIKGDTLIISSEIKQQKDDEQKGYIIRERSQRSFSRLIRIPEGTKIEDISANLDKGILSISIPKKEPIPPKKVEITTKSVEENIDIKKSD
ncbi:MAG: Hsp20/alpha crystallin family protein [Promethearchaeota archaeon]